MGLSAQWLDYNINNNKMIQILDESCINLVDSSSLAVEWFFNTVVLVPVKYSDGEKKGCHFAPTICTPFFVCYSDGRNHLKTKCPRPLDFRKSRFGAYGIGILIVKTLLSIKWYSLMLRLTI